MSKRVDKDSNQGSLNIRPGCLLLGILFGLVLGILGNLLAAWIQQDILQSAFTPRRLLLILGLAVFSLFAAAILEYFNSSSQNIATATRPDGSFRNLLVVWSKLKSFGKKIDLQNVASFKSEIEIDTRDSHPDKE